MDFLKGWSLSNGTYSLDTNGIGSWTNANGGIENIGSGWYRCYLTGTVNDTNTAVLTEAFYSTGAYDSITVT